MISRLLDWLLTPRGVLYVEDDDGIPLLRIRPSAIVA